MHYEGWVDAEHANSLEKGFRMGGWRVRPHAGELCAPQRFAFNPWHADRAISHVEPKAMRVLLALAARPGEFVSKDELIRQAWDGRPVTDDVLTRAIHALRAALNDDARDPRFIETRSNAGYRLLVPVKSEAMILRYSPSKPVILVAACLVLAVAAVWLLDKPEQHPSTSPKTIAVLPFIQLSDSSNEDYLSAAMTEALILNLAQLPDIRVISRTSVMHLAGHEGSAASIAQQLGADFLVEGSVQTENGQVRVVAQLIEPYQDGHLWAQHFDRPMDDILALQQEISAAIALQIGNLVTVTAAVPVQEPLPSAAMHDYLQARYLLAQNNVASVESAEAMFSTLASRFPEFAPAHLGLAQSLLYLFKAHVRDRKALDQGLAAAKQFAAIGGATSESHTCIGQIVLLSEWDFDAAEAHYRAALKLNPSDTIARRRYVWLLVAIQEYDHAKREIHQIRLLDPLYYHNDKLATLMLYSGQIDAAIEEFERLDETSDLNKGVLRTMGTAYLAAGRDQQAHLAFARMLEVSGVLDAEQAGLSRAMSSTQLYRHIIDMKPFASPIVAAGFQNLLGNTSAALAELELAVLRRDQFVLYLGALPELASLHGNPRFQAILETIGVRPENLEHLSGTRLISAILRNPQVDQHEK